MTKSEITLLKRMQERPAVWVGTATLNNLNVFLAGYNQALRDNNLLNEDDDSPSFHDWIAKKTRLRSKHPGLGQYDLSLFDES